LHLVRYPLGRTYLYERVINLRFELNITFVVAFRVSDASFLVSERVNLPASAWDDTTESLG